MPNYSNMRKPSLFSNSGAPGGDLAQPRRTISGRAIRANATRPANYYARQFSFTAQDEEEVAPQIGFFPAVTFFSNAIAAMPQEVVRHFTLMKEVEAKIHGPAEQLGDTCDELMELPVPRRQENHVASAAMMSFTAPNSAAGSANASVVNGVLPNASRNGQDSTNGSVIGDESMMQESEESLSRRKRYDDLRTIMHTLLPNMDEKNVVLAEAVRVLDIQLDRIDSVMPYVDEEIPEEARLGSMTHWAYSDNRTRTKAAVQAGGNRRDVAATNNLAAAAHAIHETEIAQTRREAGREAAREKAGKAKHREDSEFEERPRKTGKVGKAKVATTGLGIINGEPVKRRKVDKSVVSVAERQTGITGRVSRNGREIPRSTPDDLPKKNGKPVRPAPIKRRGLNSAQGSPALASSPLSVQIPQDSIEPNPAARPQSARLRQNSTASNLRHERKADSRPSSAIEKSSANGAEKPNVRKRTRDEAEIEAMQADVAVKTTEGNASPRKMEDPRPMPSRSNSSNKTPSGRASKVGTPRSEHFPPDPAGMTRTRSTRSAKTNEAGESQPGQKGHKRNGGVGSMSGLMKQIAPFNRSPDLDRHRSRDDDSSMDSDDENEQNDGRDPRQRRSEPQMSRPVSRSAPTLKHSASSPKPALRGLNEDMMDESDTADTGRVEDDDMPDGSEPPPLVPDNGEDDDVASPSLTPQASFDDPRALQEVEPADEASSLADDEEETAVRNAEAEEAVEEDEEEEGEDLDPDDPNEPKYCYCLRGSYGDMVGCDNPKCPREWFHLGCTDLTEMPSEEESWFCNFCRPRNGATSSRRGTGRGRGKA